MLNLTKTTWLKQIGVLNRINTFLEGPYMYSGRRPLRVFWPKAPDLMRARRSLCVQGPKAPQTPSTINVLSQSDCGGSKWWLLGGFTPPGFTSLQRPFLQVGLVWFIWSPLPKTPGFSRFNLPLSLSKLSHQSDQ